jgi:hypothetical protein
VLFRDRVVQDGGIVTSMLTPKAKLAPLVTPYINDPAKHPAKGAAWWRKAVFQLVLAEENNEVVPPHGVTREVHVGSWTGTRDLWHDFFRFNHSLQIPVTAAMAGAAIFGGASAYIGHGWRGEFDTRKGRTAVFATTEGGYLAYVMGHSAFTTHDKSPRGLWEAVTATEDLGGKPVFWTLVAAENLMVVNQLGLLDPLGNADNDPNLPWSQRWKDFV